jgi:hypothetical protein
MLGEADEDEDETDGDEDDDDNEAEDATFRMTMNPESPMLAAISSRVVGSMTHTHAVVAPTTR